MCKPTKHFTLCACSNKEALLKNYWVLYRFNDGKYESVMGDVLPPVAIDPKVFVLNSAVICDRLNTGKAFDKPYNLQTKDRLLVSCEVKDQANRDNLEYGFEFNGKIWESKSYSHFDWLAKHDAIKQGPIK